MFSGTFTISISYTAVFCLMTETLAAKALNNFIGSFIVLYFNNKVQNYSESLQFVVGLGGLGVTCSRVQIRLRSMDFFQDIKILSISPPGGTLS